LNRFRFGSGLNFSVFQILILVSFLGKNRTEPNLLTPTCHMSLTFFFHLKICLFQDFFLVKLSHQYQEFVPNFQRFINVIIVIINNSLNKVDNTTQSSNIFISHKIALKLFEV
jgi:hypothetical protein